MERILIVRLGSMGDIIHAMPAVMALREALPQSTIGWVVEEPWLDLLRAGGDGSAERFNSSVLQPLVDVVHPISTKAWRRGWTSPAQASATWTRLRGAVAGVRSGGYQVALDLQGSMKSAVLTRLSGAARRTGPARPWEAPAVLMYTHAVQQKGIHVIERGMELAGAAAGRELGFPGEPVLFPRDPEAERWCDEELGRLGVGSFALMAPGAGWAAKRWPAERFGPVAAALAAHGLRTLITTGPGEEHLSQAVQHSSNGAAHPVSCSLGQLMALTRRAKLFLGGDTGPLHLADALRIPVVAIFGPTDPARNGPIGAGSVILRSGLSSTTYSRSSGPDPGLLAITPAEVISAARHILARDQQDAALLPWRHTLRGLHL